jgi:hypothetical protein
MSIEYEPSKGSLTFEITDPEKSSTRISERIAVYAFGKQIASNGVRGSDLPGLKQKFQDLEDYATEHLTFYTSLLEGLTSNSVAIFPERNHHPDEETYIPTCRLLANGREFRLDLVRTDEVIDLLTQKKENQKRAAIFHCIKTGRVFGFKKPVDTLLPKSPLS